MTQSIVDVLLPVCNGAETIAEAVESILRQTTTSLRMLVIDDGSTDQTPQILAALASKDSRITVLTKPNGGIVDALNAGLRLCRADFIARQDADDISDPSRLAIQLAFLRSHSDCVAVSGAARHIDERGRFLGKVQIFPQTVRADPCWAPSREPYLIHPFLMVRRGALEAIGGYRYVYHSEDTDLYWRLLERGKLHNLDMSLGDYRMHANSISGRSIVNGRIMALNSQLAALSALRRRAGRADIRFPKDALADCQRARTLSKMHELGRQQLDDSEASYLRIAMAAKLLELTAYRPYELELDDCRFICSARRERMRLAAANRREIARMQAAATARLLGKGFFHEAITLAPLAVYLPAAARLVLMALPGPLRQFITRVRKAK